MYPLKIILLLLLVVFPISILAFLSEYIKARYKNSIDKQNFFNPLRYRSVSGIVLLFIISFVTVNFIFPEKKFDTPQQRIKYGIKREIPSVVKDGYSDLLKNDSLNIDHHFNLIFWHFQQPLKHKNNEGLLVYRNDLDLTYSYEEMIHNNETSLIGNLGYGFCELERKNYFESIKALNRITDNKSKYLNYLKAKIFYYLGLSNFSEEYYKSEIHNNGYLEGAYRELAKLYIETGQYEKAIPFIYNHKIREYMPAAYIKDLSFLNHDFPYFVISLIKLIINRTNLIGLIAALMILITWLIYLRRIDIYERENWIFIIATLLLGMLVSFASDYIYSYNEYNWGFTFTNNKFKDFLFSVIGIGAVEEAVKIIPLLLLLLFTKVLDEPFDYIFYASVSALGFAFIENLLYFKHSAIHIIHGRALLSVVCHMFNTSLIAYGMILAKYKWKRNLFPSFILFFILASLAHGIYNYLLISNFLFVFIIYYYLCIKVWGTIMNNALNNSRYFSYDISIEGEKLSFYLVISLTAILVFEYISIGWIYGASAANSGLSESSITGSVLILFLATRLSRFDLIKKHWNRLVPSLNPFRYSIQPINYVGLNITIQNYKNNKRTGRFLPKPVTGRIIDRVIIYNESVWDFKRRITETNWFLIKLESPLKYGSYINDHILLKFRRRSPKLKKEKDLLGKVLLIKDKNVPDSGKVLRERLKLLGGVVVNIQK